MFSFALLEILTVHFSVLWLEIELLLGSKNIQNSSEGYFKAADLWFSQSTLRHILK